MPNQKQLIGKRIRELRKARGLTQEQLAERSGLDYTTIGALERGVFNPSLKTAEKIASAMGMGVTELITLPGGKPATEKEIVVHRITGRLDKLDTPSTRLIDEFIASIIKWFKTNKK